MLSVFLDCLNTGCSFLIACGWRGVSSIDVVSLQQCTYNALGDLLKVHTGLLILLVLNNLAVGSGKGGSLRLGRNRFGLGLGAHLAGALALLGRCGLVVALALTVGLLLDVGTVLHRHVGLDFSLGLNLSRLVDLVGLLRRCLLRL